MTGSPFSNVLSQDPDDSTFRDVEASTETDTTSETAARPPDSGSESSLGVEVSPTGVTKEAEQDETAGDAPSGPPSDQT